MADLHAFGRDRGMQRMGPVTKPGHRGPTGRIAEPEGTDEAPVVNRIVPECSQAYRATLVTAATAP